MYILKELKLKNFRSWRNFHIKNIDNLGLTLIHGENGSGKCVDSNSYIYKDKKLISIKDLHDSWEFGGTGFLEDKNNINTIGGYENKTSHLYTEVTNNTIKIITEYGFSIEGTKNHPILIINKNCDFEFKKLSELKKDDFVCIDRSQYSFPFEYCRINYIQDEYSIFCKGMEFNIPKYLNEDLSTLLGYYIANGSYWNKRDRVSISTYNNALYEDIKNICNRIDVNTHYMDGKIDIGGVWFARFFKYLLDDNCNTARYKTVPSIILKSPKNCQSLFLRSLIDCDGYYCKKGSVLEYYTASKNIANIVHLMLLNFGIISKLSFKNKAKVGDKIYNHKYYTLSIGSSDIDIYFEEIGSLIYNKIDKHRNPNNDIIPYLKELSNNEIKKVKRKLDVKKNGKFFNDNGFSTFINCSLIQSRAINITYKKLKSFIENLETRKNIIKNFNSDFLNKCYRIIDSNFYFDKIESIKEFNSKKRVYDVSIPETHSFYSNGFINHNSSVRHAIEYLLSDSTSESIPLDELTYNSEGDCELYCLIYKDDTKIEITKYRDHSKYGNRIIFSVNGDADSHTESDRRETQKNINKYLNINKDILGISTIFSKESPSFPESRENDRKKIIYDAKDLHKYKIYSDNAKDKVKEIEEKIKEEESKLEYIEDSIADYKDNIIYLNGKIDEWEELKKIKIDNLKSKIKEKEEIDFNKEIKLIKKAVNSYKINVEKYECAIRDISKYTKSIDEGIKKDLLDKDNSLTSEISTVKQKIRAIKKDISNSKDGICPILNEYCDRLEDDTEKKKELEKELKQLNIYEEELYDKKEDIEDKLTKIFDAEELNKEINDKTKDLEKKIFSAEKNIDKYENEILRIKDKEKNKEKEINDLKNRLKEKQDEDHDYTKLISKEKRKIKEKELKKLELQQNIDKLNDDIKYYEYWKIGYGKSGIPNMKAEGFLESIEIETNRVLSKISDSLYVKIESQSKTKKKEIREKVEYKVYHPEKTITDYNSYSGGQRQRIQIADKSAFNSILGNFNFMFLDEVLELSLDKSGKDSVMNLLKEKSLELGALFVISHDEEIQDKFDNILNIKLEDGESRL
ncbi:MAG: LAGLIDADG family homing endonuclease, partial [Candidatus Helarchaeota archaeon]